MPTKGSKTGKKKAGKGAEAYEHKEEKLLLRPDVGLQPQFTAKKPPTTYRYDSSLDLALSWDVNPDRERGEALIARIEREVGTPTLETKGYDRLASLKYSAAQRWVVAVNAEGSSGRWAYRMVKSPGDVPEAVRLAVEELARA